jgi:elongation factor 1-alpha
MTTKDALTTKLALSVSGSVDSGKSTFIGVLTTGKLDDGNGLARKSVAKHEHEIKSGQTSDISTKEIVTSDGRVVSLIDLCGHEKYLKTTAYGLSGYYPDYGIVIVDARKGIYPMTKQHVTLQIFNNIPIVIFVARCDIAISDDYNTILKNIGIYLKNEFSLKTDIINNFYNDAHETDEYKDASIKKLLTYTNMLKTKQRIVPVVSISNKTGYYIDVVKQFIFSLEPREFWDTYESSDHIDLAIDTDTTMKTNNRILSIFMKNMPDKSKFLPIKDDDKIKSAFYIDATFDVKGTGLVVSGINRGSALEVGSNVYMGPFGKEIKEIRIRSIHNNISQPLKRLEHHDRGCIAFSSKEKYSIEREIIKKGMIISNDRNSFKNLCYRFNAVVTILQHPATIKTGFCSTIHMGTIKQESRLIIDPEKNKELLIKRGDLAHEDRGDYIRANDFASVTFKFINNPEIVERNTIFTFRGDLIQGIGIVLDIIPINEDANPFPDSKDRRKADKDDMRKKTEKIIRERETISIPLLVKPV